MNPNAPKKIVWIIGMIAGLLGIIGHYVKVDVITANSFWLLLAGFVLLAVGTTFKNL